jgi:CheY-like chemotaxis protein
VDDDATVRLLMRDALSEELYMIDEVENGIDALDLIKIKRPDLVLLDVNMPGMNGFDVCTEIHRLDDESDIFIVMVTGLEDSASIEKAYDLGATDFINKPINWDIFPYRIQYLIKSREAIIEIKNRESQLKHIEDISRIITQDKNKETIMRETMLALLDIFSADRALVIRPDEINNNSFIIDCEVTTRPGININNLADPVISAMEDNILYRADNSEYPIISHYDATNPPPVHCQDLNQQMIKSLPIHDKKNWYLVIQKQENKPLWTISDAETLYRICLRLTGILSRYLLTEKLHQNESLLRQAQEIGHLGNWNWNALTGHLTWSDEIYRIYGYKPKDFLPKYDKYFEIEFEEDLNRLNLFKDVLNKKAHSYKIDHRIRTFDNNVRWVHEQCIGTYDATGNILNVNGIVQDITDAHIKKEQEVHNNKMDAIGQLTSGIAHDFGNLMTVARGNLELLAESMSLRENIDTENMELIEDARSAVDDSVELTKQLLSFSRKQSISPVYVNIEKTINKFEKIFQNTLGDTIKMLINVDKDLPDIYVDPSQFESALLNIIINARNAILDGGKIYANAQRKIYINAKIIATERSQEIIRNADNELGDECVCISLKDNGSGMSNEVLEHAIEPFYTTRINQGTGLGLSMVYGFIKQSGGELIIHSKLAKGTTIYMQFPKIDGKENQQNKSDIVNILPDIQATILIVEDRPTVRQFAARCLKKPGIKLLEANDAVSARKLLEDNTIDLLFTDILMPGDMNGHELADWACQKYPALKVLLTTAMENNPNNKQPIRNQRYKLLPKPYSKRELIESISRSLEIGTT